MILIMMINITKIQEMNVNVKTFLSGIENEPGEYLRFTDTIFN